MPATAGPAARAMLALPRHVPPANTLPAQTALDEYACAVRQDLGRSSPLSGECVDPVAGGGYWTASFLLAEWRTYAPVDPGNLGRSELPNNKSTAGGGCL